MLPHAFKALEPYNQWIIWKRVPLATGKTDKLPICPNTYNVKDAHDASIHMPYADAVEVAETLPDDHFVGFVITEHDPFWFIDLDNCATAEGVWDANATEIMQRFPGAAIELSQSGTGLHLIGTGSAPTPRRVKPQDKTFDGLFTEKRFVAMTFNGVVGDAATEHNQALYQLTMERLYIDPAEVEARQNWTTEPVTEYTADLTDQEIIDRAIASKSKAAVFGGRASFEDMWTANGAALGKHFPDDHGARDYDASDVDLALAQHLAFWTGNNCERMDRLMRQSSLMRDKWDARPEYLPNTITKATARQRSWYQPDYGKQTTPPAAVAPAVALPGAEAQTAAVGDGSGMRVGMQYYTPLQQLVVFEGCVYVRSVHKILIPDGSLLEPKQFKAHFGGYSYSLDAQNSKSTRNAWEAFTETQALNNPKVVDLAFRPDLQFGEIIMLNNRPCVNSFLPNTAPRVEGDVSPLLNHIQLLLPDAGDREILLSYMAAVVQMPGVKFQWCPVIQGVQGNGKTALFRALSYAVGEDYCHQLDPDDVTDKFNAWIERKLLIGVEEIRTAGRYEIADRLKPMITNDRIRIQGKGTDQRTGDNCANFMMFSNYRDAVHKTVDDRRYCVLYTNQQSKDDLRRDGMLDGYFKPFYEWLKGPGAPAIAHYFATRPVNVDVLGRAPETTSTRDAEIESLGVAEQIVMQCVELKEPGFCGGFINSKAAQDALQNGGKRLAPRAVAQILESLGYERHPALVQSQGRIGVRGERFHLYIKQGTPLASQDRDVIRESYERAQGFI